MQATLYVPNQPARSLTAGEIKLLGPYVHNGLLTVWGESTEHILGVPETDVLFVNEGAAVWVQANAADCNAKGNPQASRAAKAINPALSCLVGPVLIIQA